MSDQERLLRAARRVVKVWRTGGFHSPSKEQRMSALASLEQAVQKLSAEPPLTGGISRRKVSLMTKTTKLSADETKAFASNAGFRKVIIRGAEAEAEACRKVHGESSCVIIAGANGAVLHTAEAS